MLIRQRKLYRIDSLGWFVLAFMALTSTLLASEKPDHIVVQSGDGDETYCLLAIPEGWRLERLPNRLNSLDSFLLSPLFGDLPSISIDVYDADETSDAESDDEELKETALNEAVFETQPDSIDGQFFLDSERDLKWSRKVDDRLMTITVEMTRNDYRFLFRFLGRKSQRPTFEPTIKKVVDQINFSPESADVESALAASKDKEQNLNQTIDAHHWSNENRPEFQMTLDSEENAQWVIWITVFVVVVVVLACLILAERFLRSRQEEVFAQEVTDYMDARRTPKGYDRVSPHFTSGAEADAPPPSDVDERQDGT